MKNNIFRLTIKFLCLCICLFSVNLMNAQSHCINDTVAPIAICQKDFSIEIFDSTISYTLHAKDLNNASLDNCTSKNELHFAFSENPNDTIYVILDGPEVAKRRRFLSLFAFDKNGLFSSCRTSIIINYNYPCRLALDTIPPTVPCDSLGVAFIAGTVELKASFFCRGSTDNCTDTKDIKFSFSTNPSDTIRRITKADSLELFTIYATDLSGNQSKCITNIFPLKKTRIYFNYFHDQNLNCQLDESENMVASSEIKDTFKLLLIESVYDKDFLDLGNRNSYISFFSGPISLNNITIGSFIDNGDGSLDLYHNNSINNPEIFKETKISFYTSTPDTGQELFFLFINDNLQTLQLGSSFFPFSCDYEFTFTTEKFQQDSTFIDFPVYLPEAECPVMFVDIGTPFIRRCFDNIYTIQYCNYGLETAKNAYIDLSFDEHLDLISSQKEYELLDDQQIRIPLGDVPSAFCDRFQLTFKANCNAELGATHCVEAKIFPDTLCTPPSEDWSGAAIEVSGNCSGDSVQFQIKNIGDGDMLTPSKFIVIEDVILRQEGEVQLLAQESVTFSLPANGSFYRMQAAQVPDFPYPSAPTASIEGCGIDENGNQSFGFVNQFTPNDFQLSTAMDCQENRGAFDPNDKQVFPTGTGEQHFTEKNIPLKYKIRFQNTGTDTAFNVIIRDTLSEHLNPMTLRMGSSSHPYDFLLLEKNILVVRFHDILLPDSMSNEAASHGYFEFEIVQDADLSDGTIIQNQAAIYFDFNEPIFTNRVFNTIGFPFTRVISTIPTTNLADYQVVVMPNPFSHQAIIELKGKPIEGTVSIFNTLGQEIQQLPLQNNRVEFIRHNMESGLYFYSIANKNNQLIISGMMVIQDE